jgi:predicted acylesterase/phospholipase RssA
MRALVLSGGGLFGAWQAGAWAAIAGGWMPELIVGASVGSLNGYAISCGASPEQLWELWRQERLSKFGRLSSNLRDLTEQYRPRIDFAAVATDLLRMKPKIFRGKQLRWVHLAASCALPLVFAPVRIEGRLYADGGLLNPLPVWAAVELGATEIIALHALPEIPSWWLRPPVRAFRRVFGVHPPLPSSVSCAVIQPGRRLGSTRDALEWRRENIERWLRQGREDAAASVGISAS